MKRYSNWNDVPENLKTKTQLAQAGLKLAKGQEAVAVKTGGYGAYELYDTTQAIPKRTQTAAQKSASEKSLHQANKNRVCAHCYNNFGKRETRHQITDTGRGAYICNRCYHRITDKDDDTIRIIDPNHQIRTFEGVEQMKDLLDRLFSTNNFVVLDTETTGLDNRAEAVSIGIIDHTGAVLLDTLVKPVRPITADVTAINGVTNDMLVNAPTIIQVLQDLHAAVNGKTIVVYNAPYDLRIMNQSFEPYLEDATGGDLSKMQDICYNSPWLDVMAPYAEYWGDWNDYHQSYKWHKLTAAARQQGVKIVDAHRAVGDCLLTLGVMKAVHKHLQDTFYCVDCHSRPATYEGRCNSCNEKLYGKSMSEILRRENKRWLDEVTQ